MKRRVIDWKDCAAKLAAIVPRERLHPAVLAWAEQCGGRTKWSVALSGGADSLALLLLLWAHWPKRRARLQVLHFDHRLRGRESRADAKFCEGVCRSLGVPYRSGEWMAAKEGASEAEARTARMGFFAAEARVVWLGHQQDDIAETMLMRLARGSGTGGLAAPRPVQVLPRLRVNLRPLLSLKKAELVDALTKAGAEWREDASNASGDYFRNRVRLEVMPAWTLAAQRDALAGAARSRELLEEDEVALEAWLDGLGALLADGALDVRILAGKPRALVRRALHRWLLGQRQAGELSRAGFDGLLAAVERGTPTRQSLGVAGFARLRGGVLRFERVGKNRPRFRGPTN